MNHKHMKKVKITVLKTKFEEELAEEFGIDGLKPIIFKLEATNQLSTKEDDKFYK